MKPGRTMNAGRRWAYGGAALGVSLSVAANVEHVLVQGNDTAAGAVVSAAACPVILLVALEVIARTRWPDGLRWVLLRWLALPTVAVVAASISYLHMRSLLLVYGESTWAATVGPLAVDGLMAVAVGALLVPFDDPSQQPSSRVEPSMAAPTSPAIAGSVTKADDDSGTSIAAGLSKVARPRPGLQHQAASRRTPRPPSGGVEAARSGLLEALAAGPARQADLVRATGLPRRTVRDHLAVLVGAGDVVRSGQVFTRPTSMIDTAEAPSVSEQRRESAGELDDVDMADGELVTATAGAR